ncbi:MAG TPA: response regulator [Desulfuromonadales bacterium]|nr:response regulator [Desulfuromonadales bacterium]
MSPRVKRLLVIDDSKTFVMYIALLLRRLGFEVFAAENAIQGLKMLKTDPPDGVLLDLVMPDMNGTDILRHIRSDENLAQMPVIMVSTDASDKAVTQCRQLGACDFLRKPVRLRELNSALQQVLQYPGGSRRHLRVKLNQRITVRHGEQTEELFATSLSEGGIFLRKEEPLPTGLPMEVVLPLGEKTTLPLKGEVIYHRDVYQKYLWDEPGNALRFDALSPQQQALLQEFITRRLAGDLIEEQRHPVISADEDVSGK